MFDDEPTPPWLAEDTPKGEEAPPKEEEKPKPRKRSEQPPAPATEVEYPKKQLNTHWARPRFLQYDYLYNYMHNYYDDYIEYLDRRMRGYEVEAPRPQTWAERALRTYTRNTYPHSTTYLVGVPKQKSYPESLFAPGYRMSYQRSMTALRLPRAVKPESALLNTPHWANTWHSEHSKDYYNRKYKAILF